MNGSDLRCIAQRQTFRVRIEGLAELTEVGQRRAQLEIGMLAVQQQTENGLSGASIIDDLFGEEYRLEAIVLDHGSSWFVVLHPFEEENQSMDWSERENLAGYLENCKEIE